MVRARAVAFSIILVCIVAGLAGCAGSTPPSALLRSAYLTARDGLLQYRCPIGWFDATADSQAAGHLVWLLRNDYSATIAVQELHMGPGAWEEIRTGGIMHLADVTMALAAGGKPYLVERRPEPLSMNGWRGCTYELTTSSGGDILRVTLVDGGKSLYMVTALGSGDTQRGQRDALRSAQDAFLSSLRWNSTSSSSQRLHPSPSAAAERSRGGPARYRALWADRWAGSQGHPRAS